MTMFAFDTHEAVKALQEAGATEPLAEAVVATVGAAMGENLATKVDITGLKADLAELRTELTAVKADVTGLRTELTAVKADVTELRTELTAVKADVTGLRTELTAVKADVTELRTELTAVKADVTELRTELTETKAELKADLAGLEVRLYRQLWVLGAGVVGLTVTLMKLLN